MTKVLMSSNTKERIKISLLTQRRLKESSYPVDHHGLKYIMNQNMSNIVYKIIPPKILVAKDLIYYGILI